MPSYYNPYNIYPVNYANQMGYSSMQQPAMIPQQTMTQQSQLKAMEWVEGEVGAKAFQMPQGWPANQPIPLWDSTDTVIWLKSWGPMGIPNPMQKLKYVMPEQQNQALLTGGQNISEQQPPADNTNNFATKDDINTLREEIRMLRQHSTNQNRTPANQNGSNTQTTQNRGGNP